MTSETFYGPVDSKWKKTKLVELATSLGIAPVPPTVLTIIPAIKKHLVAHPELAEIPNYQGLFVYRSHNTQARKQEKKSTDKTAEDLAEDSKELVPASGKFTTDPPAQHARLDTIDSSGVDKEVDKSGDESRSESTNQPSSLKDINNDGETDDPDDPFGPELRTSPTPSAGDDDLSIDTHVVVVSFQAKNTSNHAAEEVLIAAGRDLISVAKVNGKKTFKTSLARLIPQAIANLSPKKAADTRILRPGVAGTESLIQLGSVGAFLAGEKPRSLDLPIVDQYTLRSGNEGLLVCDLYLDETESSKKIIPLKGPAISPMKPLELARWRKDAKESLKSPRKKAEFVINDRGFIQFLWDLLNVQPRPARAENVGLNLERYLALEGGYNELSSMNWGRPKGGYRVPSDHESDYSGQEFTKSHVQQAFEILPTLASNDAALFDPVKLLNCPDILSWMDNSNGEHKAKFARMSTKNFREYIAKQDDQAKLRRRDADVHSHKKASKKERKRHQRDHGEDGEDGHVSKKKRSSGYASDNLDG